MPNESINLSEEPKTLPQNLTPEAFLEWSEKQFDERYEYIDGQIRMMATATKSHAQICVNSILAFANCLFNKGCLVYVNDTKVAINKFGKPNAYLLPDLVIVSGAELFNNSKPPALLNPTAIIEILSESTEAFDRNQKFDQYAEIESLKQYMLIDSRMISAEIWEPITPLNDWKVKRFNKAEQILEIAGCQVKMGDLYNLVDIQHNE